MIILICPICRSRDIEYNESSIVFKCNDCKEVFTYKETETRTFEDDEE